MECNVSLQFFKKVQFWKLPKITKIKLSTLAFFICLSKSHLFILSQHLLPICRVVLKNWEEIRGKLKDCSLRCLCQNISSHNGLEFMSHMCGPLLSSNFIKSFIEFFDCPWCNCSCRPQLFLRLASISLLAVGSMLNN
jgi:hypothetical protein